METKIINQSFKNIENSKLSIQFSLDGFSFSILNIATKKTEYFFEYLFKEKLATPEKLFLEIEEIFKKDLALQQDFSAITVIHQNDLATFVPNPHFDESKLKEYLKFNIKVLATDFITFDSLDEMEAKNIFVPYVNINNYIFQNFGEFEFSHHLTVLTEKLLRKNTSLDRSMFVNVNRTSIDIVVLKHKKLLLVNTFSINTKEDFIYYILFVAEQLKMDTNSFQLFFTGMIQKETEFYKIAYQYIKNIHFFESSNLYFYENDLLKHQNFILLG